ncbi:MAG: peptidoglycan bridge formation glycyltransferase FemA/FemB family protein [Candidatus Staskawiczbacteria bacterium]|nr:peptidoglycan bridge formation glycyltransferase FemA/FemB family protein [Candidatus Staskawiczbacteria bacterium]
MEIKEITDKQEWEGFLLGQTEKTFLQSWNWGEFNKSGNGQIWRLGVYNGERLLGVSLVIKVLAKRGTFLFIPHGPVLMEELPISDKKEILELILLHLGDVAQKEKASFIRVSPILLDNEENNNIFADLGFRNAPIHASAYEATWKLDIFPVQEDLVHKMRKTTRYLIRKAMENKDISIEISTDPKNIEAYQKLNKEVSKRQHFVPFSNDFVKNEFEIFAKDNEIIFILGRYKNEIAAGAMIVFWSGIAFYHQAASLSKFAKFSVPYLLQWEAIKEAEKRGCKVYDFWGFTDPQKFPRHPWAGPTLFKMGFGGYKKEYVKTQDFVISKKYWVTYIIETFRRFRRGL